MSALRYCFVRPCIMYFKEEILMSGYEFGNVDMIVLWQKYLPMRPMGSGAGYWCGRLQSPFLVRVSTLVTIWEFQRFPPSTNITSNTLPFVELLISTGLWSPIQCNCNVIFHINGQNIQITKGTNGHKKCSQFLTPFSGSVYYDPSYSECSSHFLMGWNSPTANRRLYLN